MASAAPLPWDVPQSLARLGVAPSSYPVSEEAKAKAAALVAAARARVIAEGVAARQQIQLQQQVQLNATIANLDASYIGGGLRPASVMLSDSVLSTPHRPRSRSSIFVGGLPLPRQGLDEARSSVSAATAQPLRHSRSIASNGVGQSVDRGSSYIKPQYQVESTSYYDGPAPNRGISAVPTAPPSDWKQAVLCHSLCCDRITQPPLLMRYKMTRISRNVTGLPP